MALWDSQVATVADFSVMCKIPEELWKIWNKDKDKSNDPLNIL